MDPLSAIASVIAIYELASAVSGLCFRYGQGVRGADREADLIINEIDTFLRYLRTLKDILATEDEATDGASRLQNLCGIISAESAALKMCRIDLEGIRTRLIKVRSEGRFKGPIHKVSWPLKQEEVKKTLDTLKKFNEAVDRALNVDNNGTIRGIDSTTKRIQDSLESAEAHEIKEKIMDWLAHPDPSEIHEIVRHDRNDQAKTGRWFLDGNAFELFKTNPQSVLWLHGDSGCGKSVLCSAVIDEILTVQRRDTRTELAYWYFSMTDKKRTSVDSFLRALIAQLVFKYPVPRFLLDLWTARKLGREAPKTADLEQTIQKILAAERSQIYFVVIDALDESDETERAGLLQFVRNLTLLDVDIHIFITSRTNTIGVQKGMKELSNLCDISMEGQDTDHDILAHVTERLENDDALRKWSPDLRRSIKDTLIKDAGGMFRWVECQLQAVRKCRKPTEVRKTLTTLPKDLHEVYARELAKVDDSASQDLIRLLEWLAFPQRRLRLEEAVDMLAVDMESDSPAFSEENRMVDAEDILKMCGSLVRLDTNAEVQNYIGNIAKYQTLTAAHASVIDFLTTQPIKVGSTDVFNFSRAKANLRMAETCLLYLRYFSENDITLTKENTASYPFAQQCALIWDDLYRELMASSEPVDMARLNGLVMELLSCPRATLNWLKLNNPDQVMFDWLKLVSLNMDRGTVDFDAELSHVKPAIYYAAHLGFFEIVKSLIQKGETLDEIVGPPFGTLLVAASAQGRTDVVSLLLDSGADPNLSAYFYYGTPLAAAIEFGRFETVELLLGREGVDINGRLHPPTDATDEVLETVDEYRYLRRMIKRGINRQKNEERENRCIEIGTELIKLAETANTKYYDDEYFEDRCGRNEIISASLEEEPNNSGQSTDIRAGEKTNSGISDDLDKSHYPEDYLIRADAALEKLERSTQGMIYIAAEYDTQDILEILLAAGADPNVRGGLYGTALEKACHDDLCEDVVQILLKNGARANVYGGVYGSSLHAACAYGSIRMIESIISAGADVNRLDAGLSSPLIQASGRERTCVVKLLLEYGAKPNLQADDGATPLAVASKTGSIETVKVLLDAGSDVNRVWEIDGSSPLVIACAAGRLGTAKLLVEAGADLHATNLIGHSALLTTVFTRDSQLKLFEYLVYQGADPLQGDKRGCNALHYAARAQKSDVIKILLEYDISLNMTDHNGWSSLHWAVASTEDSAESVKLLLQSGCDKSIKDKQCRTALDLAKTFMKKEETAILGATSDAYTKLSDDEESRAHSTWDFVCDGCEVERKNCKPESWHRCKDCTDFDFCFRCVLDKDIIHFKDHTFSNEPA